MKPKIYVDWKLESDFDYEKTIEIFVDKFPAPFKEINTIKIVVLQEVFNIAKYRDHLNVFKDYYDYVFTYDQEILNTNEKARHFLCINTWINDFVFKKKEFGVSTLIGGKNNVILEGYNIRHNLWNRQNEINIPKYIYLSNHFKWTEIDYTNRLVLGDSKNDMFNTQYHIAIENTSYQNMFTEKIIDCFQTKTIPIYYGCPNISDFFNIDGILIANSLEDIIKICNNITPDFYESKLNAIEDNYIRSMNYLSHKQILERKLNELLKKIS